MTKPQILQSNQKLSILDGIAMRAARRAGRSAKELAAEYKVDVSHAFRIVRGNVLTPTVLTTLDDETYLWLARGAKFANVTVAEYVAQVLRSAAK